VWQFENSDTQSDYAFKNAVSTHGFTLKIENTQLNLDGSGSPLIDSITASCLDSILTIGNTVTIGSSVAGTSLTVNGDKGTSGWQFTSGTTGKAIAAVIGNGEPLSYSLDCSAGGQISLEFDATTWGTPQTSVGTNFQVISNFFNSYAVQTLTDGATINWNIDLGVNASVTFAGNRAIANPTGSDVPEYADLSLTMIQDTTGGWQPTSWGNLFLFPNGVPYINSIPGSLT